jgi:hypothetical protein
MSPLWLMPLKITLNVFLSLAYVPFLTARFT